MKETLITNARVYTESEVIENGYILIENCRIKAVGVKPDASQISGSRVIDVGGKSVLPGFIDLQVNGAGGYLVTDNAGRDIPKVQRALAQHGTTSFLVATSPCTDEEHFALLNHVSKIIGDRGVGSNILGVHMEGPFLNAEKSGANDPTCVSLPDAEKFKAFVNCGTLKLMTISPEIGDFSEIIRIAKQNNVVLSIGHSTATYEQAVNAFNAGIEGATHLFNTMNGIAARDPGIIGATSDCGVFASVISDGRHVHPFNLNMLYKCIGAERLILITDSAPTAGTSQEEWNFGGMKVFVRGFTCYSEKGSIMGSSLTMNKGASIAKQHMHCSTSEIVKMCAENPARFIGCFAEKGSISVGKDADLIILEDEDTFDINKVFIAGEEFN